MTDVRSVRTPATANDPTFDWTHWGLEARRVAASAAVLAYAIALWARDAPGDRVLGMLATIETALLCLPWRMPRTRRSAGGFWAESLVSLISPAAALVVAAALGVPWLHAVGAWPWYLVALLLGFAMLAIGGMRPGAVFSGEIAFALGSTCRAHARARAFNILVGPPGEEALFRAPTLLAPHPASFGLLAAAAFVGRHHVQPGSNGRGTARTTAVEVLAAASLLALVLCSGSVYPAVVAHLVNNMPGFIVELQREDPHQPWTP